MIHKIKALLIIFILFVSILNINQIIKVKADSGWDSSYDSSESHDSDSSSYSSSSSYKSHKYTSSYHSSSSSGHSNPKATFIFFTIFIFIILFIIYRHINYKYSLLLLIVSLAIWLIITHFVGLTKMSSCSVLILVILIPLSIVLLCLLPTTYRPTNNRNDISEDELHKYTDKSLKEIKDELYNKFIKIQEAWMNFDYDTLKELCNNEIYNTYYEELEALKLKNGKNIMAKFELLENKIIGISSKGNKIIVECYINVAFYDYVINSATSSVINGSKTRKINNQYELKFILNKNIIDTCPNCGGKIESGTTTCEHCKAVIVQDSNSFVMSSKRRI